MTAQQKSVVRKFDLRRQHHVYSPGSPGRALNAQERKETSVAGGPTLASKRMSAPISGNLWPEAVDPLCGQSFQIRPFTADQGIPGRQPPARPLITQLGG